MPDLYAPAGRDFVDRCHSNPLCKFVCKFCAIGCVFWWFCVGFWGCFYATKQGILVILLF